MEQDRTTATRHLESTVPPFGYLNDGTPVFAVEAICTAYGLNRHDGEALFCLFLAIRRAAGESMDHLVYPADEVNRIH